MNEWKGKVSSTSFSYLLHRCRSQTPGRAALVSSVCVAPCLISALSPESCCFVPDLRIKPLPQQHQQQQHSSQRGVAFSICPNRLNWTKTRMYIYINQSTVEPTLGTLCILRCYQKLWNVNTGLRPSQWETDSRFYLKMCHWMLCFLQSLSALVSWYINNIQIFNPINLNITYRFKLVSV